MADYDPRTDTGIPTEPVGSLPRPAKLQEAYAKFDAGEIEEAELQELQDAAAKDSVERMEATGRRSSPTASSAGRASPPTRSPPRSQAPASRRCSAPAASSSRSSPTATDGSCPNSLRGPFAYNQYAADALRKSIRYASKPMKQAVIAPSMLALLYPLKDPVEGYSREEFEAALIDECEKDIRQAFAAGAARVSVDFTEGRLATREDPRNPWTGAGLLPHFIELINRVMARFSAEERTNIGVHTCPGGDRDSVHSADVPYNNLLSTMFDINAGYFLIQLASERDRDPVYEIIGKNLRSDADGVTQMAYLGTTVTQSPRVESAQEIADQLIRAANFIDKNQIGSTDDCGFSPFSIDEKPNHGSPDYARDVAFGKIKSRVEGSRMAAEKLGL